MAELKWLEAGLGILGIDMLARMKPSPASSFDFARDEL